MIKPIKPGQKRKTLYVNALEYVLDGNKFVHKTIKKNYYIIDCRDYTDGYYGFHEHSWGVDECKWYFTEEDLDKVNDYDSDFMYILYSERPYSKEEMQDKIKSLLEDKIQKYTIRIYNILNKINEAEDE